MERQPTLEDGSDGLMYNYILIFGREGASACRVRHPGQGGPERPRAREGASLDPSNLRHRRRGPGRSG
jgi:hypothetical protein